MILEMGGTFSCVESVPDLQRLPYDLTPLKSNPVPLVWLVGPPGSGRTTQAKIFAENSDYEVIHIASLLKNESKKDTDRGKIIRNALESNSKKVPDFLVIDLIKESMLPKVETAKGFIFNGFPRNSKQASLFVEEIGDVSVVLYLFSNTQVMIERNQNNSNLERNIIKKNIVNYAKEVREGLSKFGSKLEKIETNAPPSDVHGKIKAAMNIRLNYNEIQ